MKIKLGAQVVANDGAVLGNVDRLVLDPDQWALVALIVHRGRFLTEDRIVERTLIEDVGADGIVRLALASPDAEALPQFIKAEYVTPSVEMDSVLYPRLGSGFMAGGGQTPGLGVSSSFSATTPTYGSASSAPGGLVGTTQYGSMNFEVRSNLPSEVVVFEHKAEVVDANGKKIGHVEEIMENDTGAITGLRLRGGLFGRHHAYVPTEAVTGASPKRVRLSVPAEALTYVEPEESTNHPQIMALTFEDESGADGMVENVEGWEQRGLLALDDVVVVTVTPSRSVELWPRRHQVGQTALRGAGAGVLAGLLVGGPIVGFVIGASVGAITGSLRNSGLDDNFVREISGSLRPNTSALFLLVRDADLARIADELRPYRAQLCYSTLPPEHARQLHAALAHEASAIPPAQTVETPSGGPA